jgi:hypothetical protein
MQEQTEHPPVQPEPQVPAVQRPKAALEAQAAGVLPIIPTTIEEAQRYASGLIQAGIVPDAFKFGWKEAKERTDIKEGDVNAPLVLMGVLKSMEIGVPPQTGLAGLLPLNGRFAVWGDLASGLVQRGGQVANQIVQRVGHAFDPNTPLGEWPDDYGYEVRYWRKGQEAPYIGRFTVRDAKRANLWMNTKKQPWVLYPDRMLFNRARAFPLRDGFADALMGLSIAEEVMDTMPSVEEERRVETKRLSALTDDEPETASEAAGEPPVAEGSEAPAETENAPQPATEAADGETKPLL